MTGEVISPLGGFKIRPADGLGEFKISRAGAGEGGHMAATAENLTEIVAIRAHIESLGAVDPESDNGQSDLENLVFVDPDLASGTVDGFSFPGQFVEGHPVFFNGGNHGRNLVEFAGEFGKGSVNSRTIQGGNGFGFEDFSGGILGVGGFAEFQSAFVLFVLSHQQVLHPGGFADDEHEEAGGDRVEGAAVTNFPLVEAATHKVNNVVGSAAGGFVDQEETVQLRDHGIDLSFTITFTERPERVDSYDWGGTNGKSQSAEWLRKKQEVR